MDGEMPKNPFIPKKQEPSTQSIALLSELSFQMNQLPSEDFFYIFTSICSGVLWNQMERLALSFPPQ